MSITDKQHSKGKKEVSSLERHQTGYMHNHRIEKQTSVGINTHAFEENMFGEIHDEMYCVNEEHEHYSKNIFPDCDVCQYVQSSQNEAKIMNKQNGNGLFAFQDSPTYVKQMKTHLRSNQFMAFTNCDDDY